MSVRTLENFDLQILNPQMLNPEQIYINLFLSPRGPTGQL